MENRVAANMDPCGTELSREKGCSVVDFDICVTVAEKGGQQL